MSTFRGNGDLSYDESKTHFTAWALMKSPLLIGFDVSALPELENEVWKQNLGSAGLSKQGVARDPHQPRNYCYQPGPCRGYQCFAFPMGYQRKQSSTRVYRSTDLTKR